MAKPLKAGLVGCGSVSQRGILPHLSQPDAREKVRVVAVADAFTERARLTAERFGVPQSFAGVDEMLEGTALDLVLVATPIAAHFSTAMSAIRAGKHVYVQKTMTSSLAEADELLAAAEQACVRIAAAPGYELCPATAAMRRVVAEGRLGRAYMAYSYTMGFGHESEPIRDGSGVLAAIDPRWYYRAGAGPVPDMTVYALQLMTAVLGPVRRVTALGNRVNPVRMWQGERITIEVDDNNLLLLEFASGVLATAVGADCRSSARIPWGALGLYGSAAALEVTDVDWASGYPLRFELQGAEVQQWTSALSDVPCLQGEHLQIEEPHVYADIMDLVDAIIEQRAPRCSAQQARHVVEIVELARRACQTGQTQSLTTTFNLPAM
ncbi:MAG: Gfo/Idh/MocA family protein [Planctomycetaceae bacterium]